MKKCVLVAALFLVLWNAKSQVYYKSATFDVIEAVKSTQFPGVMGSPVVTTLNFKMVMKRCTRLQMDSFWLDGFADKVNVSFVNGEKWDGKPMKGDTLNVTLVYYRLTTQEGYPRDDLGLSNSTECAPPIKHKGGALFRYTFQGQKYYFSIKNIKQGENLYAP
jgi:hypothetical protein